jgi:hypothetical protein
LARASASLRDCQFHRASTSVAVGSSRNGPPDPRDRPSCPSLGTDLLHQPGEAVRASAVVDQPTHGVADGAEVRGIHPGTAPDLHQLVEDAGVFDQ